MFNRSALLLTCSVKCQAGGAQAAWGKEGVIPGVVVRSRKLRPRLLDQTPAQGQERGGGGRCPTCHTHTYYKTKCTEAPPP